MKNQLIQFAFEGNQVRTKLDEQGNPWFVATDVCAALEIQNVTQAMGRLDEDERSMLNIGRQGDAVIINESGLYSLVLGSRKPEAKRFKRWVTHEVLPSIRKTGTYSVPGVQPAPNQDEDFSDLVYAVADALAVGIHPKPVVQNAYKVLREHFDTIKAVKIALAELESVVPAEFAQQLGFDMPPSEPVKPVPSCNLLREILSVDDVGERVLTVLYSFTESQSKASHEILMEHGLKVDKTKSALLISYGADAVAVAMNKLGLNIRPYDALVKLIPFSKRCTSMRFGKKTAPSVSVPMDRVKAEIDALGIELF